ncbi:MAG: hypothetical protein A3F84_26880 [Candidatus Handelsmanbacteria bacterium RIFCSPLOWO2_12_FULL_64_10]|uniref:Uncharacterized protein n=1 Tax=Handelsmanbacteria sp. (strain RIFCSPLOWO2_12_FULL_64_10) TaxID=1817868 RepID=A0A1F6CAD6_HANXR|nr:MAG: hypothetical protein A3F84_26880 [Candidatus Handelsmanbacteria bacterium RIFCSPLOWO2_12_FULL_64_10]
METQEKAQRKVISNVGTLDLRNATEASVAGIRRIGNVGMLLYSPDTAPLITRFKMGNIGSSIEAPSDAKLLSGQVVFNRDYFKDQTVPLSLIVAGQLIIHPDVPAEDVSKGLRDLVMSGQIICPEHLTGAIQSKLRNLSGQMVIYTRASRMAIGALTLDETYLKSLQDGVELVVIGKLNAPKVLPNDLLGQKIRSLQVIGRIVCREENAQALLARLDDRSGFAKLTAIPAGFEPVEKSFTLDADLLKALPGRKLYCTERVQIDPGVDPTELEGRLEALIVKDLLICPAALKAAVGPRCNLIETKAIFYEGTLWLVDDKQTLLPTEFDYLEGKATLVVFGKLTVASEIDPKLLADRLARVHNFGQIRCTPAQMSAVRARLGMSEGKLTDSTQEKAEPADEDEDRIGNAGYLKL